MSKVIILILGMMVVTYIPRLLPFIFVTQDRLPNKAKQFLKYIPYTALGALIIPGAFTATPEIPIASTAAIILTAVYVWFRGGIIIPVLGSIGVTFMILYFKLKAGL